jgi:hypothetical protein
MTPVTGAIGAPAGETGGGTEMRTARRGGTGAKRVMQGLVVAAITAATALAVPLTAGAAVSTTPDATARVTGTVYAVAQVGTRTIIGGNFTAVGNLARRNLAAIRADGTVDPTFNPSPDGIVYAVAGTADGQRVYAGGAFANAGGTARANLAAFDAASGAAVGTWNAGTNGTVHALTTSGTRLYVGGAFTAIGTSTRRRLAAVDQQTGAVQLGFNPFPDWTVKAVGVSPDGTKVYAAGGFTAIGGTARRGGAEVLASTGAATAFNPASGGVAISLAVSPDGSRFLFSTTDNRLHVYAPAVSNTPVYTIQSGGDTQAIAVSATEVYFGGHFSQVGAGKGPKAKRAFIASARLSDGAITTWNPGADGVMGVWATAVTPSHLLVGGDFDNIGGRRQDGFARFAGIPAP